MIAQEDVFFFEADGIKEVDAKFLPIGKPLQILPRHAEKFQFHLFKFTGPEDEIARRDFVAEGFADLADAKGQFFTRGTQHVFEVDKNALCGFGPQVDLRRRVFVYPLERFEHQIEFTDAGKGMMHEGFDKNNPSHYTREWFSWANAMYSEMVLNYLGYELAV